VPARTCPVCASTVRVPDGKAGKGFDCPECGEPLDATDTARERPKRMTRERPTPAKQLPGVAVPVAVAVLIIVADVVLLAWLWLAG
jgi:hypothetical protein